MEEYEWCRNFDVGKLDKIINRCNGLDCVYSTASVAEWLRAWDTLTMFEATVCVRS